MSKLFYIFIITVVAVVKTMAQDTATLQSTGTHFLQPVEQKNWVNHNGDNFTDAKYKLYNGQTYITLTSNEDTVVQLDFNTVVKKGKLAIEVTNTKNEIIYAETVTANKLTFERVALKGNEIYHITFTGKETSGSYSCLWKAI